MAEKKKKQGRPEQSKSNMGRPYKSVLDQIRKLLLSRQQQILQRYHGSQSISYLRIFKQLLSGLESWQVGEFLKGKYDIFIEVLLLMMENQFPAIEENIIAGINYKNSFVCQPVPESLVFGLMKLRIKKGYYNPQTPIYLQQIHIKSLYMASLLLIGVGQIDKEFKIQKQNQTTQDFFHQRYFLLFYRRVTNLIDRNTLLVPKVFYQIQKNWQKIMDSIRNQIEEDQKVEKKKTKKQNPPQTQRQPSMTSYMRQQLCQQEQKKEKVSQEKKEKSPKFSKKTELQMEEEYMHQDDFMHSDQKLENAQSNWRQMGDFERKIWSEKKQQYNEDICQNQEMEELQQEQKSKVEIKRPSQRWKMFQSEKKVQKKSQYDPAIDKAVEEFNYEKKNTRDRTKRIKKQKKGSQTKEKRELQMQQQTDYPIMQRHEFIMQAQEDVQYDLGNYNFSEDSYNLFYHQSLFASDEQIKTHSEGLISSQDRNLQQEMQVMEIQSEGKKKESNPNRAIRHQSREIDVMVDSLLQDRSVIAQSIANYIYHSLMVANVKLVKEQDERDTGCRKNLSKQFQKKQ